MTVHPVRLYNWELQVPNLREYHILKREIFSEHRYYFETDIPEPVIVDVGSYIGLSTLYFKRLFPSSLVVSLEPHQPAFELLQHNVEFNGITGVLPVNQALWSDPGKLTLYADVEDQWWSTAGIHEKAWDGTQKTTPFTAEATTLVSVLKDLDRPIDLLKIDAEGSEWNILFKRYAVFDAIKAIVVEYHPQKGRDLADFVRAFPSDYEITLDKQGKPAKKNIYQGGLTTVWAVRK